MINQFDYDLFIIYFVWFGSPDGGFHAPEMTHVK